MVGLDVISEPPVEFERDTPFGHIESEFTESSVIVLPAAIFLFEVAVTEFLDSFFQRHFTRGDLCSLERGAVKRDRRRWKVHPLVTGKCADIFDLALIAFTVKIHMNRGNARG